MRAFCKSASFCVFWSLFAFFIFAPLMFAEKLSRAILSNGVITERSLMAFADLSATLCALSFSFDIFNCAFLNFIFLKLSSPINFAFEELILRLPNTTPVFSGIIPPSFISLKVSPSSTSTLLFPYLTPIPVLPFPSLSECAFPLKRRVSPSTFSAYPPHKVCKLPPDSIVLNEEREGGVYSLRCPPALSVSIPSLEYLANSCIGTSPILAII